MTDLEQAQAIFHSEGASFVLVKDDAVLARGTRDGIGELLAAVESLGAALEGASMADKIVGKAVALVAVHAGLRAVYSPLASQAARRVLEARGIPLTTDRMVPLILNKRGDGACPMERLTMPLEDPREAVSALATFVAGQKQPI